MGKTDMLLLYGLDILTSGAGGATVGIRHVTIISVEYPTTIRSRTIKL